MPVALGEERPGVGIFADVPGKVHRDVEGAQVPGDVRRAAEHGGPALDVDDGHGRLGGNPASGAPEIPIEHQIADHENPAFGEAVEKGVFAAWASSSIMLACETRVPVARAAFPTPHPTEFSPKRR